MQRPVPALAASCIRLLQCLHAEMLEGHYWALHFQRVASNLRCPNPGGVNSGSGAHEHLTFSALTTMNCTAALWSLRAHGGLLLRCARVLQVGPLHRTAEGLFVEGKPVIRYAVFRNGALLGQCGRRATASDLSSQVPAQGA